MKTTKDDSEKENKVYYPEVAKGIDFDALVKEQQDYSNQLEARRNVYQKLLTQRRVDPEKREYHVAGIILKWADAEKFSIPYSVFGHLMEEHALLASLLNKLKNAGCFGGWDTNPYRNVFTAEYIFKDVSADNLKEFLNTEKSDKNKVDTEVKIQINKKTSYVIYIAPSGKKYEWGQVNKNKKNRISKKSNYYRFLEFYSNKTTKDAYDSQWLCNQVLTKGKPQIGASDVNDKDKKASLFISNFHKQFGLTPTHVDRLTEKNLEGHYIFLHPIYFI